MQKSGFTMLLVEQPFRADQAAGFLVEGEVQLDRALAAARRRPARASSAKA